MSATPVTSGADAQGNVLAGPFKVSIATFAPNLSIPSHFHEWSCVSVLLEGRFEQRFPGKWCDCPPGVVLAKPPGERHEDRWSDGWSRHLIIEIDPERHNDLGASRSSAEEIVHVGGIGAETIAREAWRELTAPDSMTPVALEGLALQLLARVQRGVRALVSPGSAPSWLAQATDFLHENFRSSFRLADVAAAAGVHPDHLSRVFSSVHRLTVGEYVRRLRVDAAAIRLVTSGDSISTIAFATGFADQSHLTRVFKRVVGLTPGRYRAMHRRV